MHTTEKRHPVVHIHTHCIASHIPDDLGLRRRTTGDTPGKSGKSGTGRDGRGRGLPLDCIGIALTHPPSHSIPSILGPLDHPRTWLELFTPSLQSCLDRSLIHSLPSCSLSLLRVPSASKSARPHTRLARRTHNSLASSSFHSTLTNTPPIRYSLPLLVIINHHHDIRMDYHTHKEL